MQGRSAVPDQDPGPGPGPGPGTAAATLQMLQQEQARLEQLQKVLAEQLRHIRQQQIALIMAQQPDPSMAPALAQPLQAASAAAEDEVHSNSSQLSLLNTRLHEQDGIPAGARFPGQVATQTVDDREKDSLGGAGDITPLQVPVGRPTFAQMTAESLGAGQPWKQNTGAQGAESGTTARQRAIEIDGLVRAEGDDGVLAQPSSRLSWHSLTSSVRDAGEPSRCSSRDACGSAAAAGTCGSPPTPSMGRFRRQVPSRRRSSEWARRFSRKSFHGPARPR